MQSDVVQCLNILGSSADKLLDYESSGDRQLVEQEMVNAASVPVAQLEAPSCPIRTTVPACLGLKPEEIHIATPQPL